jgi:hypothetical protein
MDDTEGERMTQQSPNDRERDPVPPYAGRQNEPGEQAARDNPLHPGASDEDMLVSISSEGLETTMPPPPESEDEAGEPVTHTKRQGGAFDDPQEFERRPPQDIDGVSSFTKLGAGPTSEAIPKDPESRGIGPLPVQVALPLMLLLLFVIAFLLYRWM